jgi:hypothetical protein
MSKFKVMQICFLILKELRIAALHSKPNILPSSFGKIWQQIYLKRRKIKSFAGEQNHGNAPCMEFSVG